MRDVAYAELPDQYRVQCHAAKPPRVLSASNVNQRAKPDSYVILAKPQHNSIGGAEEEETGFTNAGMTQQATRCRPAVSPLPWDDRCRSPGQSNPSRKQMESSLRLLHSKIRHHRCAPVLPLPRTAQLNSKQVRFTDLGHQPSRPATAGECMSTVQRPDNNGTALPFPQQTTSKSSEQAEPSLASGAMRHGGRSSMAISCGTTAQMDALLAHDSAQDSPVSVCAPLFDGKLPSPQSVEAAAERYIHAMDGTNLMRDGKRNSSLPRSDATTVENSPQIPSRTRACVTEDVLSRYVTRTMQQSTQQRKQQLCVPLFKPFGESLTGLELASVLSEWTPQDSDADADTMQSASQRDEGAALGQGESAVAHSGRWRMRLGLGRGARKVAPDIDESSWRRILASFPSARGPRRQPIEASRQLYGCNLPG